LLTCNGADAARSFVVSGKLTVGGSTVSETMSGSNGSTTVSTNYFLTVSSVTVDGACAGSVEVGTNGVGASAWVPVRGRTNVFSMAIGTHPSGTVTWTIQFTLSPVVADTGALIPTATPYWFAHSTIASVSSAIAGNFAFPPTAIRTQINSGSGAVVSELNQTLSS
jgi:hypothetical protein